MPDGTCHSCRFFTEYLTADEDSQRTKPAGRGACRIRSPQVVVLMEDGVPPSVESIWPKVSSGMWCGEYAHK